MIVPVVFVAVLTGGVVFPRPVTASLNGVCEGIRFGTFPHPADCRRYIVCLNGKPSEQRCPNGHVFNPAVLFCVLESQFPCIEPTTAGPGEPTTTEEPATSEPTPSGTEPPGCASRPTWESFFCHDVNRALVANPMNCTQYIDCRSDHPRNWHCPAGTVYSDPYQDCLAGAAEGSCAIGTVDPTFCADRPDGSYAHPIQCNRFIGCVGQQIRFEVCPPFFVFDPAVSHCVKGNAVDCSSLLR